jgi:hypothetical protein
MKTRIFSLLFIVAMLVGNGTPAFACGPFVLDVVFSLKTHPDLPLDGYTSGEIGIVPASYGPMSLVLFYRQLNGLSLNAAERTQAINAFEKKIFYLPGSEDPTKPIERDDKSDTAETIYLKTRAKVTGEKLEIENDRRSGYVYYINCLPDAFRNAAKTLDDRIAKNGIGDDTKEWVKGQDAVFANCSEDAAAPAALTAGPTWLKQDRAYQIAAALLYQGKNAEARTAFETIAKDSSSPWNKTARFVAARTFIREASLVEMPESGEADQAAEAKRVELLRKGVEHFDKIIEDNSMSEFHASAARLLGLAKFRMTPNERRQELGNILTTKTNNTNFYNDFYDYSLFINRFQSTAEDTGRTREAAEAEKAGKEYAWNYKLKLQDVPAEAMNDELSNWIFTYKAEDGFERAVDGWRSTKSLPWFVAAISKATADSPATPELLAEAEKIASGSPAFATVRFHQIRLLIATGKIDAAKKKFDEVGDIRKMPVSSQNSFLALRTVFATSLDDYLKYAQRKPAIFSWGDDDREEPAELEGNLAAWKDRAMFDADAALFLNERVPLSVLKQAAVNPQLPAHLRRMLVIATWTRAFVLKNTAVEREFAPLVASHTKADMPQFGTYAAATRPVEREATALMAILRNPVVQPYVETGYGREDSSPAEIDSIRGNWWCGENHSDKAGIAFPSFLTDQQMAAAKTEKDQLIALGESATALTRRTIEFARKNPAHPKTPELLHLAVRSTRYGCTDDNTGKLSKQAFDILHTKYKTSPWTKLTPYWFGETN